MTNHAMRGLAAARLVTQVDTPAGEPTHVGYLAALLHVGDQLARIANLLEKQDRESRLLSLEDLRGAPRGTKVFDRDGDEWVRTSLGWTCQAPPESTKRHCVDMNHEYLLQFRPERPSATGGMYR